MNFLYRTVCCFTTKLHEADEEPGIRCLQSNDTTPTLNSEQPHQLLQQTVPHAGSLIPGTSQTGSGPAQQGAEPQLPDSSHPELLAKGLDLGTPTSGAPRPSATGINLTLLASHSEPQLTGCPDDPNTAFAVPYDNVGGPASNVSIKCLSSTSISVTKTAAMATPAAGPDAAALLPAAPASSASAAVSPDRRQHPAGALRQPGTCDDDDKDVDDTNDATTADGVLEPLSDLLGTGTGDTRSGGGAVEPPNPPPEPAVCVAGGRATAGSSAAGSGIAAGRGDGDEEPTPTSAGRICRTSGGVDVGLGVGDGGAGWNRVAKNCGDQCNELRRQEQPQGQPPPPQQQQQQRAHAQYPPTPQQDSTEGEPGRRGGEDSDGEGEDAWADSGGVAADLGSLPPPRVEVVASLLGLLSGVRHLREMDLHPGGSHFAGAPAGASSGGCHTAGGGGGAVDGSSPLLTGTWQGHRVAVKLLFGPAWEDHCSAFQDLLLAATGPDEAAAAGAGVPAGGAAALLRPLLVRVTRADSEALARITPPPRLRPGWGVGAGRGSRLRDLLNRLQPTEAGARSGRQVGRGAATGGGEGNVRRSGLPVFQRRQPALMPLPQQPPYEDEPQEEQPPGQAQQQQMLARLRDAHGQRQPEDDASLTVLPGDLLPMAAVVRSLPPRRRALVAALQHSEPGQRVGLVVTPFADLGNLRDLVTSTTHNPFRVRQGWGLYQARHALLATLREVAEAVAHLHVAGLAHGALKPSNVLFFKDPSDRRGFVARVSDVGSASRTAAAATAASTTPRAFAPPLKFTDPWVCTFLAPELVSEQAHGGGGRQPQPLAEEDASPALMLITLATEPAEEEPLVGAAAASSADVYALGMLIFVMTTGQLPPISSGSTAGGATRSPATYSSVPLPGALYGTAADKRPGSVPDSRVWDSQGRELAPSTRGGRTAGNSHGLGRSHNHSEGGKSGAREVANPGGAASGDGWGDSGLHAALQALCGRCVADRAASRPTSAQVVLELRLLEAELVEPVPEQQEAR